MWPQKTALNGVPRQGPLHTCFGAARAGWIRCLPLQQGFPRSSRSLRLTCQPPGRRRPGQGTFLACGPESLATEGHSWASCHAGGGESSARGDVTGRALLVLRRRFPPASCWQALSPVPASQSAASASSGRGARSSASYPAPAPPRPMFGPEKNSGQPTLDRGGRLGNMASVGEFSSLSASIPATRVEVSVSCRNLLDRDTFSKSDPICVLYTQGIGNKEWREFGRTEVIDNTLNPDFVRKFILDYFFEERENLRFDLYDVDSKSPNLSKHDFLGQVFCTLGEIVGSQGSRLEKAIVGVGIRNQRIPVLGKFYVRGGGAHK
ncbi:copine-8 isoform X3 [Carettochelys insculpta]|uniref:copine-8 isoform X3 n=1 Tax=Carettochelys insculpta TaxID=44489 RepID=UPI003EBDA1C7